MARAGRGDAPPLSRSARRGNPGYRATEEVHYRYIDVYRVQGLATIPGGVEARLPLNKAGVDAALVSDPNSALAPIDFRQSLATYVLKGLLAGGATDVEFDELCAGLRAERAKRFQIPSVFLVVKIDGVAQLQASERSWRFHDMRVVIDGINKKSIRSDCRYTVASVATAAAFAAWDKSPHIDRVADGIVLRRRDGEDLCSLTFSMGSAELNVARPLVDGDIAAISEVANYLTQEPRLETPLRLLVDSTLQRVDKLAAFLLAWASLEVLAKKFTTGIQSGDWRHAATVAQRADADRIHERFFASNANEYGLIDRIRAFCIIYGLDNMEEISNEVNWIRKNYREPLYHAGALNEANLPVRQVTGVVRQLLEALIANRAR